MAFFMVTEIARVFLLGNIMDPLAISPPKRFLQVKFSDGSGRGSSLDSSAGSGVIFVGKECEPTF